jgi:hypothetical protein
MIKNTAKKEVNLEWLAYFSGNTSFDEFANSVEKIRGVTDVNHEIDEDGHHVLTFNIDNERITLIAARNVNKAEEEIGTKLFDDNERTYLELHHLGFNDTEIDEYFNLAAKDAENDDYSTFKLKHNIKINGEEITSVLDLQYYVVYGRIKKESADFTQNK